jgi:hypothetical protein
MRRRRCGMLGALIAVALLVVLACGLSACAGEADPAEQPPPATVEKAAAGQPSRVILTAKAAERLDIQTVAVQTVDQGAAAATAPSAGTGQKLVIPYSAVLYDADGNTWTFTNPEPLVFVRAPIAVEQIQGDTAVLSGGPPAGTLVVTVGAAELLGAELGVGHE